MSKRQMDSTAVKERETEQREGLYLREVHAQTNLREQMHDDTLVLLDRLALTIIITIIMAVKWI